MRVTELSTSSISPKRKYDTRDVFFISQKFEEFESLFRIVVSKYPVSGKRDLNAFVHFTIHTYVIHT